MLYSNIRRQEFEDKIKGQYDRIITQKGNKVEMYIAEKLTIHIYYMKGTYDIGYYTPPMKSGFIHETPRPWGTEALKDYEMEGIDI